MIAIPKNSPGNCEHNDAQEVGTLRGASASNMI